MVELDGAWVLEHIPPPEIAPVWFSGVKFVEELALWGREAVAHVWELVVDEPCVEPRDEAAGHGCGEDQEAESGDGFAEDG